MRCLVLILLCSFLTGCSWFPRLPKIQLPKATVVGVKNAGTPAEAKTEEAKTTIPIPKDSKVLIVEVSEVPATATTPLRPAQKLMFFDFSQMTQFEQTVSKLFATTGTPDQSLAKHEMDLGAKKPLLYAAMASAAIAVLLFVKGWPSFAIIAGIAAVLFFAAWKIADVPWWGGLAFLSAIGVGFFYYNRGIKDAK